VDTDQIDAAARSALEPLERSSGRGEDGPYQIMAAIQEMMQSDAGIIRDEEHLAKALAALQQLSDKVARVGAGGNREYNPGWHTALDLQSILTVSEAIVRAAKERKESRGAHSRSDYPEKSNDWGGVNLVIEKGKSGEMEIRRVAIPDMTQELKDIIEERG
jgi:succinate dehydrogenase / fumarate reductase flavoprotein subunit